MILWVRDRYRNLSFHHSLMIVVTIILPVALTWVVTSFFAVDCLVVRGIIYFGTFLVWAVFVVVVVALMVEKDKAEAGRLVAEQTSPLAEQVRRLKEEHGDLIADVRLQVEDLEKRTQSTFLSLGAYLPPKSVSIRARAISGAATVTAKLRVLGGSRLARLRQRFRHSMHRVWEVVYGKSDRG